MPSLLLRPDLLRAFFLALCLSLVGLRIWAVLVSPVPAPAREFWTWMLSPLPSPVSWARVVPASPAALGRLAVRLVLHLPLAVAAVYLYRHASQAAPGLAGWLAAPSALLFGETLWPVYVLLFAAVTGRVLPDHHRSPARARNLADFWGARWNTWVSDWNRATLLAPFRRHPLGGIGAIFLFSGIWHELVVNVPLWIVTGQAAFGTMLAYFSIQGVGMLLDHQLFRRRPLPLWRWLFGWLVIIGPAPLFLSPGTLSVVGLGSTFPG